MHPKDGYFLGLSTLGQNMSSDWRFQRPQLGFVIASFSLSVSNKD